MEKQKVIISDDIVAELSNAIKACQHDRLFVLCDTTTKQLCLPLVNSISGAAAPRAGTQQSTAANKKQMIFRRITSPPAVFFKDL